MKARFETLIIGALTENVSSSARAPLCTWVNPGRFGSFFVLCFLALGGHCLQMLCLPGFGTQANTQNLPHFRAFPASIQEHSPPKCLFLMANAKLPNRPGFALLPVHLSATALADSCFWWVFVTLSDRVPPVPPRLLHRSTLVFRQFNL